MDKQSIKRTISQTSYIFKLIKDYVSEQRMHITFRAENIESIDTSFSIYLKGNNADFVELYNLLKSMDKYDRVEIKFIKSICGL